jgi:uncharacterized lipoprotein YajG
MNRVEKLLFFSVPLLMFNACAFVPQKAELRPWINVSQSKVGNDLTLSVTVVDERPETDLGHRGAAYGKAASITNDQDVAAIISAKIIEGLRLQGFNANSEQNASPLSLKVEIRLISYDTSTGFFTGGIQTKATLKAYANNNGKIYEKTYRFEQEERVVIVPTAAANEQMINETLSAAIQKLLDDTELIKHLTA